MLGGLRWLSAAVLVVFLLLPFGAGVSHASIDGTRDVIRQPVVRARAAVVMDAETGELMYAKQPDQRLPPASTTKVITAILAVDSGRLEDTVVVSRAAAAVPPSKVHLRPGDRVRVDDLTRAILMRSANDASVVVAEALAGSVKAFAARMNQRAIAAGARHTHFVNPNGLPAAGHYSTAHDLALIFRQAMAIQRFRDIAGTASAKLTVWRRKRQRTIPMSNRNRLLRGYRVPVLGKTGYTRAAKRCFVGAAEVNGREVVVALLGSTDLWGDARRLLDYGLAREEARGAWVPGSPEPVHSRSATQVVSARARRHDDGEDPRRCADPGKPCVYSLVITPSHNSRGAAERLRHFVDRRGHSAVVEAVASAHGHRYRVRVVGLGTLDAALRAGAALRAEHLEARLVPPG